ncbi:MAG: hypothetical protein BGO26_02190 [Actinobacteria bacterium 69-20]|mgnify:CR=1 FL=1|nr:hypothetical protein [Actinomycetota bacterium]OJV31284.1 MAG: hypothetical protein BGO26_02190 [Actinobacteria bacterium 69-20]
MTNLPPTKLIKDVLDGLLGREVAVFPADALAPADAIGGALALYIDDSRALGAVAGWDLPAAAHVGSAVALVPARGARAAIADQYLPENLLENLNEVSNVLATVFHIPGNRHLRLERTYRPINTAPADAIQLLYALGHRIDLVIDIPAYGAGRLAVSMRF